MAKRDLKYFDILAAKKAYAEGKNVTELLRGQKNTPLNTPEIIEVAYDLQAGSYMDYVRGDSRQPTLYAAELAAMLDRHIKPTGSLLDVGTGELTTLSLLSRALTKKPQRTYAFDISWSRLYKGMAYARENMAFYENLTAFVGDIGEIPLRDKSISITTSSHALEPNGGNLKALMAELFRITADKLVLFEPCFEINSEEGKQRMERLGYIKDVDGVVDELGGKLLEKIAIKNVSNPLNPTVCFVIEPPLVPAKQGSTSAAPDGNIFAVPGTNHPLARLDDFYFSNDTGLCFPILKSIPILKSSAAVLASALSE